jgi:glycerol-3-phosphate cytidylyltransferase
MSTTSHNDLDTIPNVIDRQEIDQVLSKHRANGKRIVFTNGCFDILHAGHVRYLAQAKALGDLLVVGLNSDSSVKRLKGETRPIVPESERAELLAALRSVDYVCIFEEDRPDALIEIVRPNIHAKGGDYRPEDLPEGEVVRKHGGEVVVLSLVEGRSTTNIVGRILGMGANAQEK